VRDPAELIAAVTGGAQPEHVALRSGALRLHCLRWGAASDPPVLLVHGNGGHAHWWDPLLPWLLPDFQLIAPDLRGHGESDWPHQPEYRIEHFAGDLLAVLDGLAIARADIIAHSMGARAAAWFAAHHPERVGRLALLDTSIAGVDAKMAQRFRGRMVGQREGRGYPSYEAAVAEFRFVPPETGVSEAITALLAHHAVRERGPGDWTFRFDRAVLSLEGDGAGDLTERVVALPAPLWIGRGSGKLAVPGQDFDRLRSRREHVSVHDFAGSHHFFLSDPRSAGIALRSFLQGR
jgi:pimeloyl-ACP methyl ester carboxylesterase